ncbi:MAG TPA: hypothetical protein VJT74_13675 [Pyrinomonadaceae bacterium]|nr:hypothetical protein [Pyrinomonadaceae bacterium]
MNAPRNNNASIFTAVICACLGVAVAGTPLYAHARRASSEVYRFESASVIRSSVTASVAVGLRKVKEERRWLPRPAARWASSTAKNSYRNDHSLASPLQLLVVTRLARAGLSDTSAQSPKAL